MFLILLKIPTSGRIQCLTFDRNLNLLFVLCLIVSYVSETTDQTLDLTEIRFQTSQTIF